VIIQIHHTPTMCHNAPAITHTFLSICELPSFLSSPISSPPLFLFYLRWNFVSQSFIIVGWVSLIDWFCVLGCGMLMPHTAMTLPLSFFSISLLPFILFLFHFYPFAPLFLISIFLFFCFETFTRPQHVEGNDCPDTIHAIFCDTLNG